MKIHNEEALQAIFEAVDNDMAIAELEPLGVSVRTIQGLEDRLGVIFLKDLLQKSTEEVRGVRNLGKQAVEEIEAALNRLPELSNGALHEFQEKTLPNLPNAKEFRVHQITADNVKRYDGAGRVIE